MASQPVKRCSHCLSVSMLLSVCLSDLYSGDKGTGVLHEQYGFGEYLDEEAIKKARIKVAGAVTNRYLSIVKLTLGGFVVDAAPFNRWFSPMRLRHIEFTHGCVDAGFTLPPHLTQLVPTTWPRVSVKECKYMTITSYPRSELKIVTIRKKHQHKRKESVALRPRVTSMLKSAFQVPKRMGSLKGMMKRGERQDSSGTSSRQSSTTDANKIAFQTSSTRSRGVFTFH